MKRLLPTSRLPGERGSKLLTALTARGRPSRLISSKRYSDGAGRFQRRGVEEPGLGGVPPFSISGATAGDAGLTGSLF
jgi:hypothetical protein